MTDRFTKLDLEEGLRAIGSMIGKVEKTKTQFTPGTSQHTLQKNRLAALKIASSLISKELAGSENPNYSREELESALAPVASLISKSEKSRGKLAEATWQHTMLGNNLKSLYLSSQLLTNALEEISKGK